MSSEVGANTDHEGAEIHAQPRSRMAERIYAWSEALTLRFVSPAGPSRLMRFLYRQPVYLYRVGLGGLIGRSTLLLVTTGRRTGRSRPTPLGFNYDPATDTYVVVSGWGPRSQWFRNLIADPNVKVQVGRRIFEAVAEVAPLEAAERVHREYVARNPRQARSLPHLTGHPFDGSDEAYRQAAASCPVILLKPVRPLR